jgi:hypothetical protein
MKKERTLQDGTVVEELEEVKVLKISTRCPEKWKLVDMETGEEYIGRSTPGSMDWRKIK